MSHRIDIKTSSTSQSGKAVKRVSWGMSGRLWGKLRDVVNWRGLALFRGGSDAQLQLAIVIGKNHANVPAIPLLQENPKIQISM